jgi:hypothetical protein
VLAFLYPSHLSIMKTVAKALQRGVLLAITLLVWVGLVLLPKPVALAQADSPKPSGLVKTTPSPVPQAQTPNTGKAVTPAPAKQPENATTKADSSKASTGGPYDVKAIEDSYKSLYGS